MRFAIVGAGAIGGFVGARLALAGHDVTLFARGPHLRAMQDHGLRILSPDGEHTVRPRVTEDLGAIEQPEVLVLGVKAHALPDLAPRLRSLIGPGTTVVSTQNGIPWWYFRHHGGEFEGLRLERIDPGGVIESAIAAESVVGSIVYFSTTLTEPGVIRHMEGHRIALGEPDGSRSERCRSIAEALIAAGLRCPITTRIRHEIWVKLLGNVAFNPISALTGATLAEMVRDRDLAALVRQIMAEAEAVASRLGIDLLVSIDQRMAGAERVGEHKTSMLQDLEAGRPMELEAVVGAVVELGERLDLPVTATRAVYACAKMLDSRRTNALDSRRAVVPQLERNRS